MKRLPYLEVALRLLYWRVGFIHNLVARGRAFVKKRAKSESKTSKKSSAPEPVGKIEDVISILKEHGVKPGDILILHSSFGELRKFEPSPEEVIRAILGYLGPQGTLALPCIPIYRNATKGTKRVTADIGDKVFTYDVVKSRPWTGALAQVAMRYPGAIRSSFPLNSLVAIGRHAEEMFKDELSTDLPTPNGAQSAWAYCAKRNAAIVCFGVDLTHNLTMIHTAEDMHADTWPVPNWYRKRRFRIINGDHEQTVDVRERHPKWAMYYAERKLAYDLENAGLSYKTTLEGVEVISIRSEELLSFLWTHRKPGYPYYLWSL